MLKVVLYILHISIESLVQVTFKNDANKISFSLWILFSNLYWKQKQTAMIWKVFLLILFDNNNYVCHQVMINDYSMRLLKSIWRFTDRLP